MVVVLEWCWMSHSDRDKGVPGLDALLVDMLLHTCVMWFIVVSAPTRVVGSSSLFAFWVS
jgi:hypothetical protein